MNLKEFEGLYDQLARALASFNTGLKPPTKMRAGLPTKDAIVLAFLFKNLGKPVTKSELTSAVRFFYPEVNDVQQGRHLAAQRGFWIESGTRGDSGQSLRPNEYMLVTLEETYPGWRDHRREMPDDFETLKTLYGNRCATCGSSEGETNFINASARTVLQQGHMDPRLGLVAGNVIPQCQICNRAYRDWFIFYPNGRVRTINPSSPRWIGINDDLEHTFVNLRKDIDGA
jgi:hypothetical protein